jgi:hypothetical protein
MVRTMACAFFEYNDRVNRKNDTMVATNKIRLPINSTFTFTFHLLKIGGSPKNKPLAIKKIDNKGRKDLINPFVVIV